MRVIVLQPLAAALFAVAPGNAMAYEQPDHVVEAEYEGFELRRYAPYLVAETRVEGSFGDAGRQAFRILAGFISGENRSRAKIAMTSPVTNAPADGEEIAMTAPVVQEPAPSEEIAMTAPVVQEPGDESGEAWLYRFVMPSEYSRETLPEPTDPRVTIREIPERLVAVRRFRGFWRESRFERNDAELRAALPAVGLAATGATLYARYDPPFMPWFLRRNEVWVPVRRAN